MLISATRMPEIPEFTGLRKPTILDFLDPKKESSSELTRKFLRAPEKDKLDLLVGLICKLNNASTLVFCNHRKRWKG